jgi:large subunit ribosomal protein L31e
MSQELERVYTIPLGKVKLSQSQHRAVRAINMIREFAQHHMKVETIKIDEELARDIWARGVRNPPRKVRVRMSKTDEGYVLVSKYDDDAESKVTPEKETKKVSDKVEEPAKEAPKKEEPLKKHQRKKNLLKKHQRKKNLLKKHQRKKNLLKKHQRKNNSIQKIIILKNQFILIGTSLIHNQYCNLV